MGGTYLCSYDTDTSKPDLYAHIYLAAYTGFSVTLTFPPGNNYLNIANGIDLSLDGNLTIDGGNQGNSTALIHIHPRWSTKVPSIVSMNGGVCLKGYTNGKTQGSGVVWLSSTKDNGPADSTAPAVFIMNGGSIRDNNIYTAAVWADKYGVFIMNGGSISGNSPAQIVTDSTSHAYWGPNLIGTVRDDSGTPKVYVTSDKPGAHIDQFDGLTRPLPSGRVPDKGTDMAGNGAVQDTDPHHPNGYLITQDVEATK
jgi:hypothetical protein